MAKRHNPSTSHDAFRSVKDHVIPNHHQKILDALEKHGEGIYEEIAGWCGWDDRNRCSRRMLEMVNLGLIERTERKKHTSTGRQAFIYKLPEPPKTQQNQQINTQYSLFKN